VTTPNTPVGQYPGIATNPDGSANFNALSAPTSTAGGISQWDIPADLTQMLAISGGRLWFDTGNRPAHFSPTDMSVGAAHSPDIGVYTGAPLEPGHSVPIDVPGAKTVKDSGPSSYDIMRKPEKIMAQFAAMSFNDPAKFLALQKMLSAGPWGTVHLNGSWDSSTESALGNAMLQYAKLSMGTGVAVSFSDYLIQSSKRAEALNATNGQTQQVQLTDPDTIRAAAIQAAQDALGQSLDEKQLHAFVARFQSAQTGAQLSTASATAQPDLSVEAMKYAQQSNPQEFHQNQRQAFLDTLVNMFAPAGSARPNMTPVPGV